MPLDQILARLTGGRMVNIVVLVLSEHPTYICDAGQFFTVTDNILHKRVYLLLLFVTEISIGDDCSVYSY